MFHNHVVLLFLGNKVSILYLGIARILTQGRIQLNIRGRDGKGVHKLICSVFQSLAHYPHLQSAVALQFGETVASVKINSARTRWGSCTSKGNINLSLFLVMAPEGAVDYCIIHELSHLKHMDHSAAFWRLVGSRCPYYEKRKEELRVLNLRLMREKW